MTIEEFIKLLDAATKLLSVLVWPAVLVFIVIRFGSAIRNFIASMGELSLKGAGFEASVKQKATTALTAAAASRPEPGAAPEATARDARAAAQLVAEIVTPRMIRRANRAIVLWVDDRPSNIVHERQALEALGITFVFAKSADEALEKFKGQSFDAIISDMERPLDPQAGYTLLDKLRATGNQTPFIIYAGSRSREHRAEARRRGAVGCTNRPDELFELVLSALGQGHET